MCQNKISSEINHKAYGFFFFFFFEWCVKWFEFKFLYQTITWSIYCKSRHELWLLWYHMLEFWNYGCNKSPMHMHVYVYYYMYKSIREFKLSDITLILKPKHMGVTHTWGTLILTFTAKNLFQIPDKSHCMLTCIIKLSKKNHIGFYFLRL